MSDLDLIPLYVENELTEAEVKGHFLERKNEGYCQDLFLHPRGGFVLIFSEIDKIRVFKDGIRWRVQILDGRIFAQSYTSIAELDNAIFGGRGYKKISSIRTSKETPFSNYKKICQVIDFRTIEAIFDPYLDAKSLDTYHIFFEFGVKFSQKLRLLTLETRRGFFKGSELFEKWLEELRVTKTEIRFMPDDEHRRFMVLNDGSSLIIGHSLNRPHKNEAVSLDTNPEDLIFFDAKWSKANTF